MSDPGALHFAGVPAGRELMWRTHEVPGPLAAQLIGPGRLLWGLATFACVAVATLTACRLGSRTSRRVPVADMALVLLLPIAAFAATNTALSPQFHLWLLPLAALVLLAPRDALEAAGESALTVPAEARRAAWCIVAATLIVPAFYPHREFATGLGTLVTAMLLLRNGRLIYATVCLWVAARRMGRTDAA